MSSNLYEIFPGKYSKELEEAKIKLLENKVVNRLWKKDHTLWSDKPVEITNRLDWLTVAEEVKAQINDVKAFAEEVKGFKSVLLLGMGGSSLCPEVLSFVFGSKDGFPELFVLDSTEPARVTDLEKKLDLKNTLFVVSTKSGGTVETISFMKYFYRKTINKVGADKVGEHFAAITDPGSGLQKMAEDLKFRKIFLNNPNIGGRFSALSLFGIVPAALLGMDTELFIDRALETMEICKDEQNLAAVIGAFTGAIAKKGVDKLSFVMEDDVKFIGAWVEQLIAESTGKAGNGILPVDGGFSGELSVISNDRCFVFIKNENSDKLSENIIKVKEAGYPVIVVTMADIYDLSKQFFIWEFATAVMGWEMTIHPFDQPDVESAKIQARAMLAEYSEKGELPKLEATLKKEGYSVSTNVDLSAEKFFEEFVQKSLKSKPFRSYISLQVYLNPNEEVSDAVYAFADRLQTKYKVAVTVGFGPRFLHSTGQLHKGDTGNGIFIQIISQKSEDVNIPDTAESDESGVTFGVLVNAQAMGDRQALLNNERNILTFNITDDESTTLKEITSLV